MKILAIRGKNLASLEAEFNIDFTSEPLKSAGIFAITGATGAGKSTILDALCLALFDDAPRLNKAEQLKIEAEDQDNITLKDSRNILRKGAPDGYAEVEFIALNGDKYRSRWMVRRARGKADGALQNTSIKLDNLSTSTEEQGTKKDLLNRVIEIIGLTFDQFTRAILLAQGDFATFLKAKQNEKAELLEKLTGTEVYSRISALIYQKTGEAKVALDILNQRMNDVKLLPQEELDKLNLEKINLTQETEPLKKQISTIEKKLTWIKQEEQFKQDIKEADNQLIATQSKIQEANPRYEYMSMIEASLEIRDTYIDLEQKQRLQISITTNLQAKENELNIVQEKLSKTVDEFTASKSQQEKLEDRYNTIKPDIEKAKELDIQIKSLNDKVSEIKLEVDTQQKLVNTTEESTTNLHKQISNIKLIKESLEKWFEEHKEYKGIIPHINIIATLLNNIQTANKQKTNVTSGLDSSKTLLKTYLSQLKLQEEEAERLNSILPTEVLTLREKLIEGEPCAVCGSIHHPFRGNQSEQDGINDKELELAKKELAATIVKTKENVESTEKSITEFEAHYTSFQNQYDTIFSDLKEYLIDFQDWETKFYQSTLQQELNSIATQWEQNKAKLDSNTQQLENFLIKIESEEKLLATLQEELKKKTDSFSTQNQLLKNIQEERSPLLKGKSIDEVESQYTALKEQYAKKGELLRTEKDKIESAKATITGTIAQLKKDSETNSEQITILTDAVHNWVNSNKHQVTIDLLKDLISKSREWINQEKGYLTDVKNQELVLSTTLQERKERLLKHQNTEDKLIGDETQEALQSQFSEMGKKQELINKRLTEIQVIIATHEQGRERIKTFEKELQSKEERYNNWAKLNDLLGSATGNKFKAIAQGYTLDVLLSYANKHLEDLTMRYKLEKISNSLALQVIDNDMLGEVRPVHSLSGGESFLISLSLALGLSSLSSNRMKIESLFIDEGFGSLDIDTLSIAMDALENLQTQGRKIGVISHVEEMKERITAQVQVLKAGNGRSEINVVG